MTRCDKSAVQRYRQVWFWLLLWMVFLPGVQAATDCNAVTEIPVSECQSLLELYNSTDGPNWKNNRDWIQTNTPCSWYGVGCKDGHVTGIGLVDEGLKGQIPDLDLPNLVTLSLYSNQLSGNIPNFSNLPNLTLLWLSENQLNGSIPNFSNLPNLTRLWLPENQLSGNIPNFSNLPNLQYLSLYSNQLSGNIPNFSNLPNLIELVLRRNQLDGNIPNFSNLPNLTKIWLGENQLSGNIPNFRNLLNLQYLSLELNCGLIAYDAAQESVLNSIDPNWQTRNPNCSVTNQPHVQAEGIITTVAGNGTRGFSGDGGPAISAQFQGIVDLEFDSNGSLYIADRANNRIRKIDANGIITTVAGSGGFSDGSDLCWGGFSGDGGPANEAEFECLGGMTLDSFGNLYIADTDNHRIRKVDTNGIVTSIAGSGSTAFGYPYGGIYEPFSGDGGLATDAKLSWVYGITADENGNLYIADTSYNRIRKIDVFGIISTVAGSGIADSEGAGFSGDGGLAIAAQLNEPFGIALDGNGNLYIADTYNHRIRKVDTMGIITTVAGNGIEGFSGDGGLAIDAQLNTPFGINIDHNNLYIGDAGNNRVRKVDLTSNIISTVVGNGVEGFSGDGGLATDAQLNWPSSVAMDRNGNLYIGDAGNDRIRKVTFSNSTVDVTVDQECREFSTEVINSEGNLVTVTSTVCRGEDGVWHEVTNQPPIADTSNGVKQVSRGGYYTCALKHDGSIVCWGGYPGNDSGVNIPPEGNEFTQITTSDDHGCALKKDSSILCWGTKGTELPSGDFIQVKTSPYITCALDPAGKISCQDRYNFSSLLPEIGDKTPAMLGESPAYGKYTQISISNTSWNPHACALRDNGNVDCWGWDNYGQSSAPSGSFTQVSAGMYWTCAINTDGNIICWGREDLKKTIPPAGTFTQLCDPNPYCAIKSDGGIACWGEVGEKYTVPEGQFTQVSCGGSSSCAVKIDGTVVCWGNDYYGEAIPPKELTNDLTMINKAPVADYYATPTNGQAPLTVALDASLSSDADGSIVSYQWSIKDQKLSGPTASVTLENAGDYSISLTVTDDKGVADTKYGIITVTQPAVTLAPKIRVEPTALNFDNAQNISTGLRSNTDLPVEIHKIAGNQELFVNPSQTEENSPDPTITRVRYAEVNLNALSQPDAAFGTVYTERLILNLFPDVSFTINNLSVNYRGKNDYTWIGKIDGTQFGDVILVVKDDRITGNVNAQGEVYRIRPSQDGWHVIQKMNPAAFPEDAPSVLPPSSTLPDPLPSNETQNSQLRSARANRENGTPMIDVMVVYTSKAAWTPTDNKVDIVSEIQLAVDETNQVYANSGIKQRLRLVHAEQLDYSETGVYNSEGSLDLSRLANVNDGFLDKVHRLRDEYRADLVSLWVEDDEPQPYCGIGSLMSYPSKDFAADGFTVVERHCATAPVYAFAHELGHNMGAHHDKGATFNGNPAGCLDGYAPYFYSCGYIHDEGKEMGSWRTIMAYDTQCNEKGYSCPRIPYFSNPDILYKSISTGDSSANNALTLNNTADIVASFRDSSNLLTEETKKFTIYNDGDADLVVSAIALESNASWIAVSPKSATIAPNASVTVNVKVYYTLAPSGQSTSRLLVSSNDPTNSVLPVNIVVDHQAETAASAPADVYDGDVQSLSVTAQAGEETYQAVLNPIALQPSVIGSVFGIGGYTPMESSVLDDNVTTYDPQTGIVRIPIGSTYLPTGEPMLFEVEMKETSPGIFEITKFEMIPVQAIE